MFNGVPGDMFAHQLTGPIICVFDPQKASRPIFQMSHWLCPPTWPGLYTHVVSLVLTSYPVPKPAIIFFCSFFSR